MVAVIRRLLHGVWSLGWLALALIGIPSALVHYIGWPFPDHWPTRPEWERWVAQPLTRPALLATFAVLVWLMWAGLVYALVVEIIIRIRRVAGWLRGRSLPPLPTPMQATASGMLGAAVFGVPAGTAHPTAAPVATPPVAAPTQPALSSVEAGTPDAGVVAAAAAEPAPVSEPDAALARHGVALPDGGWVTDQTAQAIASAAAVVWWQRRRHYRPHRLSGEATGPDDADLVPLPDTVAAVLPGGQDDDTGDVDTVAAAADPFAAHPAVVGHRDGPLRLRDLPPGGVGLVGDGAAAAARGILTATLLSGAPWDPAGDAHVVTTVTDLQTLLGLSADEQRATPGLTVAAGFDEALAVLEQAALARGTVPAGDGGAVHHRPPPPALAVGGPTSGEPVFAPLVLLAGCPVDPAEIRRLALVLNLAAHLGVTGVLLGRWPHGATWRVDPDGTTHGDDRADSPGPRLCALPAATTGDLLTLVQEARASRTPPHPPVPPPAPPRRSPDHSGGTRPVAGQRRPPQLPASAARTGDRSGDVSGGSPLRARLLGHPVVHHAGGDRDDGTTVPIRRSAALQVLVFLAVRRAGATSNELIAALWPGPRPQAAAGRLYTPVSELRAAVRQAAGADVVVRDGDRYRLDEQLIEVDVWRLQAAIAAAAAATDPQARAHALRTVIDTYTGELAAGRTWPWVAVPRETLRRRVIDAYVTLAADQADPHTAVALLEGAVDVDPVNDDLRDRARRARIAAHG